MSSTNDRLITWCLIYRGGHETVWFTTDKLNFVYSITGRHETKVLFVGGINSNIGHFAFHVVGWPVKSQ